MVRRAVMKDLRSIMEIIKQTIMEMSTYNNTQWDENYPQENDFMNDIQKGDLFVVEREGKLAGFICINKVEPAGYNELNWSLNENCIVVHRMAVNPIYRRNKIGTKLMEFADRLALENNIVYLKTDTYSINTKMNGLFRKCGYEFVGEMNFLEKEKPFYCYEKVLNKEK